MSWVKAVVLYDYVPDDPTDDPTDDDPSSTATSSSPLTLHVGDVLHVVEEPGKAWWWGQKTDAADNRTGLIPANYIHIYTPAELQTQHDGGKDPTVEKPTVPEEDSGSDYESGASTSDGSDTDEPESDGHDGDDGHPVLHPRQTPTSSTSTNSSNPSNPSNSVQSSNGATVPPSRHHVPAVALYDYDGDEVRHVLSLSEGDLLHVVNDPNKEWWDASLDESGHVGLVPHNYVEGKALTHGVLNPVPATHTFSFSFSFHSVSHSVGGGRGRPRRLDPALVEQDCCPNCVCFARHPSKTCHHRPRDDGRTRRNDSGDAAKTAVAFEQCREGRRGGGRGGRRGWRWWSKAVQF